MVVLHQDAVVEREPVVDAPAAADAVLLEDAQAGRGLARVEHLRAVRLDGLDEPARERGDPAHALHEVQRGALAGQDGGGGTAEAQDRPAGRHVAAIRHEGLADDRWIDPAQHRRGHAAARHAARLARQNLAGRLDAGIHQRQGGGVAGADILLDGPGNRLVDARIGKQIGQHQQVLQWLAISTQPSNTSGFSTSMDRAWSTRW